MKFPYPENPSDWQTAYTRDDAFKEYGKHARHSELAFLAGILIITAFIAIKLAPNLSRVISPALVQALPGPLGWIFVFIAILMALIFVVSLILLVAQSRAFHVATAFFTEFHQSPEGIDPARIIKYRLQGRFKLPPPFSMFSQFEYIIAKEGDIAKSDQWPAWCARNLGGPILLIVFDGCALYLERGNRFSRIIGPGDKAPFLEWYETIKYVVDLRPKVKEGNFDVWTKDGININLTIQIECRIGDPQKNDPNSKLVYPYDPLSVKKAIERHSVRWPKRPEGEPPEEFTWVDAAWGQVTGIVPNYIGSRMLDDLFMESRKSGQILSPEAVQEIFQKLNKATEGFGVYITDFQILEIKLPKEVEEHQKEYWKAERQSVATIIDGQTKAFHIRSREKARADAQRDLIISIADGLKKNEDGKYSDALLLSLSGILDNSLKDPLMRSYIAKESLDTLEQLYKMLNESEPSGFDSMFN